MYELTYSLFLDFLAGRPSVICNIKNYADNLCVKKDALIFSLRALHDYLSQSCAEKIDYSEFQKMLYQSTLNQDLKAHGGQVVVHYPTGKVETSLYRLERCQPTDPVL